jgi:hypothetical protein
VFDRNLAFPCGFVVEDSRHNECACHVGSYRTLDLLNSLDKEVTCGADLLQSKSRHKGPLAGSLVPGKGGEPTLLHSLCMPLQLGG